MPQHDGRFRFLSRLAAVLVVCTAGWVYEATSDVWMCALLGVWGVFAFLSVPTNLQLLGLSIAALLGSRMLFPVAFATNVVYPLPYVVIVASAMSVVPLVCLWAIAADPSRRRLRMNGLDRYFVCQDYAGMRANSHHFVDTREPFDPAALAKAVESLLREMPMARSFVREAFLGMERFEAGAPWLVPEHLLWWRTAPLEEEPDALDRRMDLASYPPWRVIVAPRREGGWRLCLTIHHSAVDGAGGMLWLERLLRRYEDHREGRAPTPFPADPPARRFRELFRPRGVAWLLRMIRRHVRPMDKVGVKNASLLDYEMPRLSGSAHMLVDLPDAEWTRLKARAEALGVSRNDLLVAASLRAADAWRRAHEREDRPFRILLPTDLRGILELPPSLQNFVGVVRSDFAIEEVRGGDLPKRVSEKVKLGRTLEEAIETPVNLGFLSAVLPPPVFRRALRKFDNDAQSFFFSYLFSQVRIPADLPRPPGTERVWVRGSLPRQPGFGIVVCPDGERITVAFEYLSQYVSEFSVIDFRDRFLAEIALV